MKCDPSSELPRGDIKKIINNFFICRKLEGKLYNPPVAANLTDFKVTEALPFSKMVVDFAGPVYTKGSSGQLNKCYIGLSLVASQGRYTLNKLKICQHLPL